jgi:hypothetical protein
MRTCNCGLPFFAAGICFCGLALAYAETLEFYRPSAPACQYIHVADLGPPAGCENDPSPHNRLSWFTSLAASSGTGAFVSMPILTYSAYDAEYAAETTGRGFDLTTLSPNDGSSVAMDLQNALLHPTKDERLALIHDIINKNEST